MRACPAVPVAQCQWPGPVARPCSGSRLGLSVDMAAAAACTAATLLGCRRHRDRKRRAAGTGNGEVPPNEDAAATASARGLVGHSGSGWRQAQIRESGPAGWGNGHHWQECRSHMISRSVQNASLSAHRLGCGHWQPECPAVCRAAAPTDPSDRQLFWNLNVKANGSCRVTALFGAPAARPSSCKCRQAAPLRRSTRSPEHRLRAPVARALLRACPTPHQHQLLGTSPSQSDMC